MPGDYRTGIRLASHPCMSTAPSAGPVREPRRHGATIAPHAPWQVVQQGYTVLVTRPDGTLSGNGREGLWDYDTRILSLYRLTIDGIEPEYVSSGVPESDRWFGALRVRRGGGTPEGPALPEDAVVLTIERRVGCGMEETLHVANHAMTPLDAALALEIDADFIDVQEIGRKRLHHGEVRRGSDPDTGELRLDYHAAHGTATLHRALRVRVIHADSPPFIEATTLRFPLRLPAGGEWRATLSYHSLVDGAWREPLPSAPDGGTERDLERDRWRAVRTRLDASHPAVEAAFEHAAEDLFALRNWEYDTAPDAWHPKAGAPTYSGVFGRDALTAAWQGALLGPEMLRGAIATIGKTQADRDSAWRDEEPGKLIHEIRRGPLSELDLIPQRGYYGTQTTPAMFVLALSEAWHWTGDDEPLRRYLDVARRTFEWAERYGDRDGDGFLEYTRRSEKGLKNHGWKDSDEAIRYPDGSLVPNPIATIEEQAYHIIALQRMAEILVALGVEDEAERYLGKARMLGKKWHQAFWVEDDGFYAMALDPEKRPVRSIGSNPGHGLAAGIVPQDVARRVADRLLAPDLFSGWGVRTLSSHHPSYNPLAYHLGSVWPVENATFALGFKRYGLDDHVERLAAGLLDAASRFQEFRLPELLGGHAADDVAFPVMYPNANSPQAWSASATIQLVQVMLGLYPFAPAHALFLVRPRLPPWLDRVTVHRVRVGRAIVTIRFHREDDGTARHEVLHRDGPIHLIPVPPPNDVSGTAGWLDAIERWILDHAPGRLARAARIALGTLD